MTGVLPGDMALHLYHAAVAPTCGARGDYSTISPAFSKHEDQLQG